MPMGGVGVRNGVVDGVVVDNRYRLHMHRVGVVAIDGGWGGEIVFQAGGARNAHCTAASLSSHGCVWRSSHIGDSRGFIANLALRQTQRY